MALGTDLPRAWSHPAAGNDVKKHILRCVVREIVARVAEARIELILHWQGGDHTELSVVKNRTGQHRWSADTEVRDLIVQLARQVDDGSIAALLNRPGHRTGKDHTWTEMRVRSFRSHHRIAVYEAGEREKRGELTLEQAAAALGTSKMTVLPIISAGKLPATQACKAHRGSSRRLNFSVRRSVQQSPALEAPRYQRILDRFPLNFNDVAR